MKNFITLCSALYLLFTLVGCSESDDGVSSNTGSSSNIQGIWLLSSEKYINNANPEHNSYEEFSLTDTTKCLAYKLLVLTDINECILIQCSQTGSHISDTKSAYSCAGNTLCYNPSSYVDVYAPYSIDGSTLSLTEHNSSGYTTLRTYTRYSGEIRPSVWSDVYNKKISFKFYYPKY